MLPKVVVLLAALSTGTLLLPACFGGGASEANAPGTVRSGPTTVAPSSPTTTSETRGGTGTSATVSVPSDVPVPTESVGTDVLPKSAPPWKKELSLCKTRSFWIVFDRDIPAVLVKRGDEVIAWAGLLARDVSDDCRDVRREPPVSVSDEPPPKGIYESVELRCNSPGRIKVDAHPIEMNGSVYGSQIYITVADTPEWLVSAVAVKNMEGRRVYVNDAYCGRL